MLNILLGTKLRTTGGTSLSHFTYAYDNDDNITAITDMVDATKSMAYGYDVNGRLTGYARKGEPSQANTYNGLDDRVAVTSGGTTRRYI